MATPRVGLRFLSQSALTRPASMAFRQPLSRQVISRRTQTTVAGAPPQTGFGAFWNSPVGPKTVHFWAPVMKWGLVLAGISDFARPVETLSLTQNLALMGTGAIWTRWCFVIKPRNVFLAAVNFFLFCVGSAQVTRIFLWNQSLKKDGLGAEIKDAAKQEVGTIEGILKDPKGAINAKA